MHYMEGQWTIKDCPILLMPHLRQQVGNTLAVATYAKATTTHARPAKCVDGIYVMAICVHTNPL